MLTWRIHSDLWSAWTHVGWEAANLAPYQPMRSILLWLICKDELWITQLIPKNPEATVILPLLIFTVHLPHHGPVHIMRLRISLFWDWDLIPLSRQRHAWAVKTLRKGGTWETSWQNTSWSWNIAKLHLSTEHLGWFVCLFVVHFKMVVHRRTVIPRSCWEIRQ